MDRRRVCFSCVVRVYILDYCDEERRSQWMRVALDRYCCRRRILEPIEELHDTRFLGGSIFHGAILGV